jgi:carboxyl-terminal processing protease
MTERLLRRSFFALLAVTAGLLLIPAPLPAEPKSDKERDARVTEMVCAFLQQGHLKKPKIDDDISRRLFHRFLKELDPARLYFLKSDIGEFKKEETDLDDQLLNGDVGFAYRVYNRLVQRMEERQELIKELVDANHDFTVQEYLDTPDYDKMEPPADLKEVRERWRKRIKFDLLQQRVADKPVPEAEAKDKVRTRYRSVLRRYKQMDNSDLLELYLYHLTTSIDPHSTYMSPATLDDFSIAMRLNLDGIGAVLRSENGQTIVEEVVPGGAAATDGHLKAGDKIVGVAQGDGEFTDVVDMKLRDVVKLIRGKRGTRVQLKVVSTGKLDPVTIDLKRQKIELKSQEARGDVVEFKKADGSSYRIGVIDLPSFYAGGDEGTDDAKSATADVKKILKEFNSKGIDGLVLDLRRNGGGALSEALSLTGLFIDQGPVVQVKGSRGAAQSKYDPEKGTDYSGPMLVLVSRFSASASEILAGALQDYGRAVIVGDPTHGKGTVQAIIDLGERSGLNPPPKLGALKLTIQQFYRVNGESTQVRGVVPDVPLPSLAEQLGTAEKDLDFPLPASRIEKARYEELKLVTDEIRETLKGQSARRVKESPDFQKLAKEIELFKVRKDRKKVPLNEKELREELARDDADKLDKKAEELLPAETPKSDAAYKFKLNFMNKEILQVLADLIECQKSAKGR